MHHGLRLLDAGQVACGRRGLAGWEPASTLGGRSGNIFFFFTVLCHSSHSSQCKSMCKKVREKGRTATKVKTQVYVNPQHLVDTSNSCLATSAVTQGLTQESNQQQLTSDLTRAISCTVSTIKCHPFYSNSNPLSSHVSLFLHSPRIQLAARSATCTVWFNLVWREQPARKRTRGLLDSSYPLVSSRQWLSVRGTQRSLGHTQWHHSL